MEWMKKWEVRGSSGKKYIVSHDPSEDIYGCSCPQWIFHRKECKHIELIKRGGGLLVESPDLSELTVKVEGRKLDDFIGVPEPAKKLKRKRRTRAEMDGEMVAKMTEKEKNMLAEFLGAADAPLEPEKKEKSLDERLWENAKWR
jgi:hypothetical protein